MRIWRQLGTLFLSFLLLTGFVFAQNATLRGNVEDAASGDALIGANLRLQQPGSADMVTGAASNADGMYQMVAPAGSYELVVSFVGYQTKTVVVSLSAGQTVTLNVVLNPEGFGLGQLVVSASRQAEKVGDAPASVSVLEAREVAAQTAPNTAAVLRNVEGVDLAQTGVDRFEVVLRGFNNAFSGAAYTLVDYRQAGVSSLGVNAYSMMPISNIDMERIEIVRGPGSALYGPGVDAGVVHFITKNPFDHQGTTISLGGGQQSTYMGAFRHAGVSSDGKIGYKIAGQYTDAEEFGMDVNSPLDFLQLDTNDDGLVVVENDGGTLTAFKINADETASEDVTSTMSQAELAALRDIPRETVANKFNLNGMLEYKINNRTSIIANGGHMQASGPFLSGIGNLYGKDFGYSYGQLRLQSGNFFAALSLNRNNHGGSYVVGNRRLDSEGNVTAEGLVFDHSQKWNLQAQYNQQVSDKTSLIYGLDYEYTIPDTDGTIYGRNETEDQIAEYGAYAQAQHKFSPKFDLTVAARADYNNIIEVFQVSPRVAVVMKPSTTSSFRATYNRAFSSPGNNSLFLDIAAGAIQLPLVGTVNVQGRGSVNGFTFDRSGNNVYGNVVASSLLPWNVGAPVDPSMDLGGLYGNLIYPQLAAIPDATLAAQVAGALQLPAGSISTAVIAGLKAALNPSVTQVTGSVEGVLVNPLTRALVTGVNDVDPLTQTTTQTVELGYKGILGGKMLVAVDGYFSRRENFVGPLLAETPVVLAASFTPAVLAEALAAGIQQNSALVAQLQQLSAAFGRDLNPVSVAGLIVGLANQTGSLNTLNQLPIAVVQPNENNGGPGTLPELMLTYRNFGQVDLYGVDLALRYLVNENFSMFANTSWVVNNFFDEDDINESGSGLYVALNAPRFKFKLGGDYNQSGGLSAGVSVRYNEAFPVASGPYVGGLPIRYNNQTTTLDDIGVEDYYLVDLGLGYDLANVMNGMRVDVQMQNVLDNKVRQFYGAPAVGRYTTARLTFTL